MSEFEAHDDLVKLESVAAELQAGGFTIADITTNADVRAYAEARHRQLSNSADIAAADQVMAAQKHLGLSVPGDFSTTEEDVSS